MKKVIKINENDLGHIINEVMDEISLKTLQDSAGKYGYSFDKFYTEDEEVEEAIKTLQNSLDMFKEDNPNPEANAMLQKAYEGLGNIKAYFERKFAQGKNLKDTRDVASYMRRKEFGDDYDGYEEHNGQITPDEYQLTKGYQNKRQVVGAIKADLKKAFNRRMPMMPEYYKPSVGFKSTYDTDVDSLDIEINKEVYDKCIGDVERVMKNHGYRMNGEKNPSGSDRVVNFVKM